MQITKQKFGEIENQEITEYTLENSNKVSLSVIEYGGIITKIMMPDRKGLVEEITINQRNLNEIAQSRPFHGAIVGPVAGRISGGRYFDGDNEIKLTVNEHQNTLHSGTEGLDTKIWVATIAKNKTEATLKLTTQLADGEGGFPGNVAITVTYSLNEANEITIKYEATTDQKTIFNPTNHVYFNLSGNYEQPLYDHEIKLNSDFFAVLDEENIPTGELRAVANTEFDMRKGASFKKIVESQDEQIAARDGLDHPFLLNKDKEQLAARLTHKQSGRVLEMTTDCAAVVIYTHNHTQKPQFEEDLILPKHSGIALETQALPDAVNQENFGSIWLEANEKFESTTRFTLKTF